MLAGLVGAGLAALAGTKGWVHVGPHAMTSLQLPAAGEAAKVPLAGGLAFVLLAAWGVLLVTRLRTRRVVAVFGVAVSLGLLVTIATQAPGLTRAVRDAYESGATYRPASYELNGWCWLSVIGTVLTGVSFALAVRRAKGWPEMGRKYDAPTGPQSAVTPGEATDIDLWKAQDKGQDPTA